MCDSLIALVDSVLAYASDSCGCLCIAAGSNGGYDVTELAVYPARSEYVLAVAATNINDQKPYYSNFADWIDVSAPGGEMYYYHDENGFLSCLPQHYQYAYYDTSGVGCGNWIDHNYDFLHGTSMASPFVVSLTAMVKAKYPDSTNQYIRGRILGTADDIYSENPEYIGKLGAGRINAYRALTEPEHPVLYYIEKFIDDGNNGIFEYGETVNLVISLKNWWIEAENVHGILHTNDPYITIEDSIGFWGDIGQEEVVLNEDNVFVITDNSVNPRSAAFTLHLEADDMEPKDIEFEIIIYPNTSTPLVTLPLATDETITTEMVISDIDNDEVDEIVVGSSAGNIYIIDYPDIITRETGSPINCTPAIGDINNDGYEEIVAGNDEGNIIVYDRTGNQISEYQVDGICKHGIVLEDVTGDGQLEIIVTTWKYPGNSSGVDGFHIIDPQTYQIYEYDTEYRIRKAISVADTNNDMKKEITLLCQHRYFSGSTTSTPLYLKVYSIDKMYNISEIYSTSSFPYDIGGFAILSGPIIANIDNSGFPEIILSYTYGPIFGRGLYSTVSVFTRIVMSLFGCIHSILTPLLILKL